VVPVGNKAERGAAYVRAAKVLRSAFPGYARPVVDRLDADDPLDAQIAEALFSRWLPSPDEIERRLDALDAVDADLARIIVEARRES
jgi:hypothetical protein